MPTIYLADHIDLARAGLRTMLQRNPVNEVVGEAADGVTATEAVRRLAPDIVFLERHLPKVCSLEITREILAHDPGIKVIVTSCDLDPVAAARAIEAGACGFFHKSDPAAHPQEAVNSVLRDRNYFTPTLRRMMSSDHAGAQSAIALLTERQRHVLQLLAEGLTNKEIANQICVSCKTVDAHRANLMQRLQIHTMAGLTKFAIVHGLTTLETSTATSAHHSFT